MNATRAMWLAWGAVVALLAYPAGAQFLGDQRAILGGEGFYRPLGAAGVVDSVTLDAPAYTRTVTASSYTLTGTSTGSGAVSWAASPSGASGACTGTDTFSCVVTVTPDATGEGVETITVTRGAATDTETLGFYVAGAHSVFLSQNVNGSYNSGLANLDAVPTWENVGTSALDVTQATGAAQPTFRTSIVGGQPIVRCDGGDRAVASTASDWTFMNEGGDLTVEYVKMNTSAVASSHIVSTRPNSGLAFGAMFVDINTLKVQGLISNSATNVSTLQAGVTNTLNVFHLVGHVLDDDGGAGVDLTAFLDGTSVATGTRTGSYSSTAPAAPLTFCSNGTTAANPLTGDLFRVLIYQSALTSTQRGINKAVDEWALGGTLPVTP